MRLNVYSNKGVLERARTGMGGTIEGFLILAGDPVGDTDAATKRFVDDRFEQINITDFIQGTIPQSAMPAMSGDAISDAGSNVVNLVPITSSGVCVNPTVNAAGLVTGTNGFTGAAIPSLDWSVIQTGHPTTVVGYGIRDAVSTAGGNVNVNITLKGVPIIAQHVATKGYVDSVVSTSLAGGVSVGDIIVKHSSSTPTGFLQCNGAVVDKGTYPALYAALTAGYDNRLVLGAGKPWQYQTGFNPNSYLNFGSPIVRGSLANAAANAQLAVTKNRIYLLGGLNSSGLRSTSIQSAAIAEDGTVGAWSNIALTLPNGVANFQAVVGRDFLYLFAGIGTGNTSNIVYRSPIDAQGNLGAWTATIKMPAALSGHQAVVTSSRIYLIGGSTDGGATTTSAVHYADLNADGSIGVWSAGPSIPISVQHSRVAVTKGRVYLLGGHTGSALVADLIYGSVNSSGEITDWTPTTVMPIATALGHVLCTDRYVYYMGGCVNGNLTGVSPSILRAAIESDGSVGTWEIVTGHCPVKSGSIACFKGGILMVGGTNADETVQSTVIQYVNEIPGLSSDMSFYYSADVLAGGNTTTFRLPDLNFELSAGARHYIKY